MSLYVPLDDGPPPTEPVLVMGMEGWIDAGAGAATATAKLLEALDTRIIGTFDTDILLDFRARRPTMRIVDGVNTGLHWPEIHLRAAKDPAGNDVLLLVGPEPDHRWKEFTSTVVELMKAWNVRMAVGLGAFPAPVPHTRPVGLASTATTEELAGLVGFVPGGLEVPSGIHGALERGFAHAGIPAVGLWARVPHYVTRMAYPAASVGLLRGLHHVSGIDVDPGDLVPAADAVRARVDELIAANPEHVALVRRLEEQHDAQVDTGISVADLPTGDELAAELERFLRDQRPD